MHRPLTLLAMASLCLVSATNLKGRDAIHADELERYDAYMNTVQDRHAIDMYMADSNLIKVDFYDGRTDVFEESASFKASDVAPTYFAQLAEMAREVFGAEYDGQGHDEKRGEGSCDRSPNKRVADPEAVFGLEDRTSKC